MIRASHHASAWSALEDGRDVEVLHDGHVIAVVQSSNAAFEFLLRNQNHSTSYALRFGGYAVRHAPLPTTEDAT